MPSNALVLSRLLQVERPSLLRRLQRILNDRVPAEDVIQDLWLKLQAVRDDPPIDNPAAYLQRAATNAARDALRAAARRREEVDAEIADLLWIEDDRPGPDRVVFGRDMIERLGRAIEALPEPTRGMFRLNRFGGLTQREIAACYRVSTTIVERHIHRAIEALDEIRRAK